MRARAFAVQALAAGLVGLLGTALLGSGPAAQPRKDDTALAGKPVAPFAIEHSLAATPTIGAPVELEIEIQPQAPLTDVTVQLSADPGLSLDPSAALLTASSAGADAPVAWRVTVVPLADGVHRIRVYAEAEVDGARQGRSAVIPIRVGAPPAEGVAKGADASGDDRRRRSGEDAGESAEGSERVIRLPPSERR